jgi:hypothetical protein
MAKHTGPFLQTKNKDKLTKWRVHKQYNKLCAIKEKALLAAPLSAPKTRLEEEIQELRISWPASMAEE